MSEAMRLYPPVWVVARRNTRGRPHRKTHHPRQGDRHHVPMDGPPGP